jgi:hypothetical protein
MDKKNHAPVVHITGDEQIELAKKISQILKKMIGDYFHLSYQGSHHNMVARFVVSNGNEKFLKKAKKIITELGIYLENIGGHGKGGNDYTILIKMSEVNVETRNKINGLLDPKILEKPIIGIEVSEQPKEAKKIFVFNQDVPLKEKNLKLSLLRILRSVLEIEGIPSNSYSIINSNGNLFDIKCSNPDISDLIFSIISFLNDKSVIRDGEILSVDPCFLKEVKHSCFALPPKTKDSVEALIKKIKKVYSNSSSPKIEKDVQGFYISFERRNSYAKIIKVFTNLGWNFELRDGKIFVFYADIPIMPVEKIDEPKSEDSKIIEEVFVNENIVHDEFMSHDEIFKELGDLFYSSKSLSFKTRKRIFYVLKEKIKEENPEGYALFLLDLLDNN